MKAVVALRPERGNFDRGTRSYFDTAIVRSPSWQLGPPNLLRPTCRSATTLARQFDRKTRRQFGKISKITTSSLRQKLRFQFGR